MENRVEFNELLGKIITEIHINIDSIHFECEDGSEYTMFHMQDCCESVSIEDINGDLDDLIGSPILQAEEETSNENPPNYVIESAYLPESFTWTFYKLATIKGYVTIRWYGSSNGHYSESVDLYKI